MPRMQLYLDEEEFEWVKRHGPGYVRSLVRADLRGISKEPARKLSSADLCKKA